MKKIVTLLLLHFFIFGFSQKYFLLDSLKTKYKVNEYTLNTKELYNIDEKVNVYNVLIDEKSLLLITVFPVLDKYNEFREKESVNYKKLEEKIPSKSSEEKTWKQIDYNTIKDDIVPNNKILNMIHDWEFENLPSKKTLHYKIVKKTNNRFYVSENCLIEFFSIGNFKNPIFAPNGTINITDQKINIKQMQEAFKEQFPQEQFPLDIRNRYQYRNINFEIRNYLSKEYNVKNDRAYQFWTLDGWWTIDGYNEHRGIDRFVYIPKKGIVGGSYDFYFLSELKKVSNEKFWDNILNEKVMIAEELK
ncbi:hypothetical protein HZQ11_08770 [Elizabethkingia anophelis]|uniref:hypothetical protein n=1 Tax=Elizabethkingia TaxID=308865 RepID=UPI000A815AAA|nr:MULTISPECIES: hypothetical protein [Elizabethkingia]MCT3643976.1 hypothetical protein [Elizabethkingia anophelis]MCT3647141.1 hypothetical protein [Elizabethkingia anophelis]MCT3651916.1 hypothetical protein [Elizabethkingia anophelis]MCT3655133.1 hypothetical protein [Elizabethkingia anophelis]MCT3659330.1 hypothetical protein [Elizabethkingia anophelis]